jgi:hypothetical protein
VLTIRCSRFGSSVANLVLLTGGGVVDGEYGDAGGGIDRW